MSISLKDLSDATYLGDGVYAGFDGYQIWIWTSNGLSESEKIALEPSVLARLNKYDAFIKGALNEKVSSTTNSSSS